MPLVWASARENKAWSDCITSHTGGSEVCWCRAAVKKGTTMTKLNELKAAYEAAAIVKAINGFGETVTLGQLPEAPARVGRYNKSTR